MAEPKGNLTIRIPPELRARIKARAARQGVRPADLYRQYLEAGDVADQRREARSAARQAAPAEEATPDAHV